MEDKMAENETKMEYTKRWSAARKAEVVLRHMKGESLDDLSREIGVPALQIEEWHQKALKSIGESLKIRGGDPLQSELDNAKKCIGELSMEIELLKEKARKQGVFWGGKW
jgi:transposase